MSSQQIARQTLRDYLKDFQIPDPTATDGPEVVFTGVVPAASKTKSDKINLSLIGAIPSLANAIAAAQIFQHRGGARQKIEIDLRRGHNYIDPDIGMTPTINGQEITLDVVAGNPFLRNIFETKDGKFVVISAVYVDLVYQWSAFFRCPIVESEARAAVKLWNSEDLEKCAAEAGLPLALCQTESSWATHPQGSHLAKLPWVPVERIPADSTETTSKVTPFLSVHPRRPLSGLKVLCVTHAIAGPSAGRTLAEHGASVLQVMFTHGFEHHFVYTYANLGTASTRLNLHKDSDRARLQILVKDAHVWIDSYRPNAISKFGFSDNEIRAINPSMIICRVRCYGTSGPWSNKPGFDMQGSASSGLMSLMGEGVGDGRPQWPPGMVINDYTTGYSAALAIQNIVLKRVSGEVNAVDGWLVSPSLTGTAMGILKYFKASRFDVLEDSEDVEAMPPETIEGQTPLGHLKTLAPLPKMSQTPIEYEHGMLHTMGSDAPNFPGYEDGYDIHQLKPTLKEDLARQLGLSAKKKLEKLNDFGKTSRKTLGIV